ncbi:hypothetical protein [Thiocystis violacea]|uniref:hypothetical protein n=1 Tax=Thiocystis violacea TaxID=13725 RepID=UPI001906FB90|nr:hypothetical protein [Thiocystis violacea]MBK1719543.1 hypothetical protein [Thiocystis violacea]
MLSFDAPSLPSPLMMRECTRPRFDTDLDTLRDWLAGLRSSGVRQAGPALIMALESLRKSDLSANRRLSVLSLLKVPVLKTCAGLPKPYVAESAEEDKACGLTIELRLTRLMFVNLHRALRQIDQEYPVLTSRQQRKRLWAIRNLFRFANRQIRYAALWKTPLPAGTWRDLHELHLYLTTRNARSPWALEAKAQAPALGGFDHAFEYKLLLLLGLAARIKESTLNSEYFMDGLEGWAAQTQLTDPHAMLGRIRLFLVEISEDAPARQLDGSLETPIRGWILQPPYPYIHELEDGAFGIGPFGYQPIDLALPV